MLAPQAEKQVVSAPLPLFLALYHHFFSQMTGLPELDTFREYSCVLEASLVLLWNFEIWSFYLALTSTSCVSVGVEMIECFSL